MDRELLEALTAAASDEALRVLIGKHALDLETVVALKAHSAHFYFDRPSEAVRVAEVARRLGNLLPDPAPALGRWTLANALLFVDRYREAVDLFDRARADYLALGRPLDAARMGVGQVWALAYTGRFERALERIAEIEPVLAAAARGDPADRRRLGGLFNNAGILYDLLGQYEESLAAYDRRLAIAQALGDELDVAHTHHNRACALIYLNAFDEAVDAFRQAEKGFIAAGAKADLVRLGINRGILYAFWGRYGEADAALAEAARRLEAMEGMDQQRHALVVYRALASLKGEEGEEGGEGREGGKGGERGGEVRVALAAAQAALAVHGPPFEEGLAWWALGRCHLAAEAWEAARTAFEQVRALAERGVGRSLACLALHSLGNLEEMLGRFDEAIAAYQAAIQQIETMRRDLYVAAFRAGFLTDKLAVYQDLALLYVRLGRLPDAFATVERAKSRLLAERLAVRLRDEAAALGDTGDPRVRALARRLQDVLSRLEERYGQARLDQDSGQGMAWSLSPAAEIVAEVERLEAEALRLIRQIERDHPLFSPLAIGYVAPLSDVQARLHGATLLQYHVARGRVRALVVDSSGVRACRDLASLAAVEGARRRFVAAVERALGLANRHGRETLTRYLPSLLGDAKAQLSTLYDLLIRPLAADLQPGTPLVVSPDGPLHYVPFHALYDGTAYLVERHVVSYTPSATVLDLFARRCQEEGGERGEGREGGEGGEGRDGGEEREGREGGEVLVVGYGGERLPQVAAEVSALGDMFPGASLIDGAEATAGQLLAAAPRCRILHLAAHAQFRPDNVMLSYLALADRRLTLAEIARLQLDAELVALSGCETGRGRLHGADLISLACGFMGAGARSLLVSLWRVDDANTAQLMRAFYRALRAGAGRAEALRTAQRELLTLGRERPSEYGACRHPAYWASFVLIGEWGRLSGLPGGRGTCSHATYAG